MDPSPRHPDTEPVLHPFIHVSQHVVQAEGVRRDSDPERFRRVPLSDQRRGRVPALAGRSQGPGDPVLRKGLLARQIPCLYPGLPVYPGAYWCTCSSSGHFDKEHPYHVEPWGNLPHLIGADVVCRGSDGGEHVGVYAGICRTHPAATPRPPPISRGVTQLRGLTRNGLETGLPTADTDSRLSAAMIRVKSSSLQLL